MSSAVLAPWSRSRETARAAYHLGAREVRIVMRQPEAFLPNLLMPLFFFFVQVGALEEFAQRSGVDNWAGFQLPVALIFAVTSGSAGLNMVADIESGYFDKLLATPAARLSILLGAMGADFTRILVQGILLVSIALATGTDFATGVQGALLMVLIAGAWGIAYEAIGFAIALKTGNSQATQSTWATMIPLIFLTTAFAPYEALSGWLRTAATYNPMTYVFRGLRALSMQGWVWSEIMLAVIAAAGLGSVTITLALRAMRGRIS